jgi:hypothetical protein
LDNLDDVSCPKGVTPAIDLERQDIHDDVLASACTRTPNQFFLT